MNIFRFIDHVSPANTGLTRSPHTLSRSEDGQSLVEFALCLPVLLIIITGIFTFGIAISNYLMLTNATNVGARQLAISRGQTTDPCYDTAAAVHAAAPTLKTASFQFAFSLNGTNYSGTNCTAGVADLLLGTPATVSVTYPCSLAVYGINLAPSCSLKAQTTELVQ